MTMSSTHLPWLREFFETAAPDIAFIDPADAVLDEVAPHTSTGTGQTLCIASENERLPLTDFNAALAALSAPIRAQLK